MGIHRKMLHWISLPFYVSLTIPPCLFLCMCVYVRFSPGFIVDQVGRAETMTPLRAFWQLNCDRCRSSHEFPAERLEWIEEGGSGREGEWPSVRLQTPLLIDLWGVGVGGREGWLMEWMTNWRGMEMEGLCKLNLCGVGGVNRVKWCEMKCCGVVSN